jgi:hypothetical protein
MTSMTIPFDSRVRVPDDILVSHLDGESVLLNLRSECYFGLDDRGTRVWNLLTSGTIQSVYETLLAEYDVDPETCRLDLTELLDSLVQQGLVEVAPV